MYLSGKQQLNLENLMGMVSATGGEELRERATQKGLDPSLINGLMNLVKGGGAKGEVNTRGDYVFVYASQIISNSKEAWTVFFVCKF